jgi:hypothetical protein
MASTRRALQRAASLVLMHALHSTCHDRVITNSGNASLVSMHSICHDRPLAAPHRSSRQVSFNPA